MNKYTEAISVIFVWIVVPLLMLCLIILGIIIRSKVKDAELQTSARAGWWAGHVLFLFFFLYHFRHVKNLDLSLENLTISISVFGGILGSIIGFGMLWSLNRVIKSRTIGFFSLILSATGSISMFSYFFIRNINHFLMSFVLGLTFGSLVYIIIFPTHVHNIFSEKKGDKYPPNQKTFKS